MSVVVDCHCMTCELCEKYADIKMLFSLLLKEENNSYVFGDYYQSHILDNMLFESKPIIEKLLSFFNVITTEWKKCRRHENDMKASVFEQPILKYIQQLFMKEEFIAYMTAEINNEFIFRKQYIAETNYEDAWATAFGNIIVKLDEIDAHHFQPTQLPSLLDNISTLRRQYEFEENRSDIVNQHLRNVQAIHDFLFVLMR